MPPNKNLTHVSGSIQNYGAEIISELPRRIERKALEECRRSY